MTCRSDLISRAHWHPAAKYPDAELQYQKVIEAEPDNAFAIARSGEALSKLVAPAHEDAVTYYRMAIDRAGESVVREVAQDELAQLTGTPVASPAATPDSSPVSVKLNACSSPGILAP